MQTILCYGDSNTWGYNPESGERYPRDRRWTGVLSRELGTAYHVIEEGLNARTTVNDDPLGAYKNGRTYLIPCLESQRPLDLVIIMLGTNDLKQRFAFSASEIAQGVGVLADIVKGSQAGPGGTPPEVLILAPPPVGRLTDFAERFAGAEEKSRNLGGHYKQVAQELGCAFLDTASVVTSSDIDGIHWEPGEHVKLGKAVAGEVRRILG